MTITVYGTAPNHRYQSWLVVYLPLWKIWVCQLGGLMMTFLIYGKSKKHVPNHRPESYKDTYSTMVSNPTLDNSSLMGNTAVFAELPLLKTIITMTSQWGRYSVLYPKYCKSCTSTLLQTNSCRWKYWIDVKSRCCFLNHPISRPVGLMLHHPIPRGLANFNNISNSSVGDGLWNCICHKKLGKMNGQQNDIGDWERRTSTRLLSTLLWITKLCCNLFRSQQQ